MKSTAVALITLLAAVVQADIKLPDPKNPSSANFGIWKVEDTSEACVGASCQHGVTDSISINGASISNPCGTGENFDAEDSKGQGAINAEGTLNFKQGICGSKPMTCQQNGSQWTCKYNAGGAVSARCVGIDNSKGVTMKDCHGSNPFKDIDNFILDLLCNSDGSFHC